MSLGVPRPAIEANWHGPATERKKRPAVGTRRAPAGPPNPRLPSHYPPHHPAPESSPARSISAADAALAEHGTWQGTTFTYALLWQVNRGLGRSHPQGR